MQFLFFLYVLFHLFFHPLFPPFHPLPHPSPPPSSNHPRTTPPLCVPLQVFLGVAAIALYPRLASTAAAATTTATAAAVPVSSSSLESADSTAAEGAAGGYAALPGSEAEAGGQQVCPEKRAGFINSKPLLHTTHTQYYYNGDTCCMIAVVGDFTGVGGLKFCVRFVLECQVLWNELFLTHKRNISLSLFASLLLSIFRFSQPSLLPLSLPPSLRVSLPIGYFG